MSDAAARVMVVDDSATIRDLIAVNLELEGYAVTTADSAETCQDLLRAARTAGEPYPDVILLDVVMPGMDGIALVGRLKSDPSTASIPVLMVSASARQRDFDLAREAGADGYVTKPFDPDQLVSEVARLTGGPGVAG